MLPLPQNEFVVEIDQQLLVQSRVPELFQALATEDPPRLVSAEPVQERPFWRYRVYPAGQSREQQEAVIEEDRMPGRRFYLSSHFGMTRGKNGQEEILRYGARKSAGGALDERVG